MYMLTEGCKSQYGTNHNMGRPTHEAPTREYTHKHTQTHTNTNKHTARPVRQSTVRAHAVAAPYIQFAEHGANSHQIALISCKTSLA